MVYKNFPVLPLRDIVLFPGMIAPLFVGREKSIKALEHVMQSDKRIFLLTQNDPSVDDPSCSDLHTVGTVAQILQILKLPDGSVKLLVEGDQRAIMLENDDEASKKACADTKKSTFLTTNVDILEDIEGDTHKTKAFMRTLIESFELYAKSSKKVAPEIIATVSQITSPGKLADTIVSHLSVSIDSKQTALELLDLVSRLEYVLSLLEDEISVMHTEQKIRTRVKKQMEKSQKDYYLNEQLKAIQKELNEDEEGGDEITELENRLKKTKLSKEALEKAKGEIKKLKMMSPMSAESTVVRNYLECLLQLPWGKYTKVKYDIKQAEKTLDKDHYGLTKVKERILEYLAVQQRTKKIKGPILCLVGPPGVGKTSLGKSIASATGRNYSRMSLGGVRDEAEIRGHRRTYIGAMPGKILQNVKKAHSSNPLFLLDEIDKMSMDYRGDPASALLEVLDPEQNNAFNDHYLEVDFDLSQVMFVATANSLDLPAALLDRMEIIRIPGYTEEEKIEIAKRHIIPKQKEAHGLKKSEWSISDDALTYLIRHYTREAGVRNLEKEIAKLARKSLKDILVKKLETIAVTEAIVKDYCGVPRYNYGEIQEDNMIGMTTGLAYTEVGGELLCIEAVKSPGGKGDVKITGKLGDVMKESVQAALSYVRARCLEFGISPKQFSTYDLHIHFPEGAIPKDGPSAGIAICTTIVSLMTGIPVKRTIAMTGEVTLRGQVLPIGGLKEKLLAALRGSIKTVLIPEGNIKDLADIPDNVKSKLDIIPVKGVGEVIEHALVEAPIPYDADPDVAQSLSALPATTALEIPQPQAH